MKSIAIVFGALAIYFVSYQVARALFGEGSASVFLGGLLGTAVLLGMAKAMGSK